MDPSLRESQQVIDLPKLHLPISVGEAVDKYSILQIKKNEINIVKTLFQDDPHIIVGEFRSQYAFCACEDVDITTVCVPAVFAL